MRPYVPPSNIEQMCLLVAPKTGVINLLPPHGIAEISGMLDPLDPVRAQGDPNEQAILLPPPDTRHRYIKYWFTRNNTRWGLKNPA